MICYCIISFGWIFFHISQLEATINRIRNDFQFNETVHRTFVWKWGSSQLLTLNLFAHPRIECWPAIHHLLMILCYCRLIHLMILVGCRSVCRKTRRLDRGRFRMHHSTRVDSPTSIQQQATNWGNTTNIFNNEWNEIVRNPSKRILILTSWWMLCRSGSCVGDDDVADVKSVSACELSLAVPSKLAAFNVNLAADPFFSFRFLSADSW